MTTSITSKTNVLLAPLERAKTYATIYDMVVIPKLSNTTSQFFNMEKNLVIKEIRRIAHFASLSINYYDTDDRLVEWEVVDSKTHR